MFSTSHSHILTNIMVENLLFMDDMATVKGNENETRDRLEFLLLSVDGEDDYETEEGEKIYSPSAFWSVENGHQDDTWNDIVYDSDDNSDSDSCSSNSLRVNTLLLTINDDDDRDEDNHDNSDISSAKHPEDHDFSSVSAVACMEDRLRKGMKQFRAYNTPYHEPSVLFQHHNGDNSGSGSSHDMSDNDLASMVGIPSFSSQLQQKLLPQQQQLAVELCDHLENFTRVLVQQGDWLQALSVSARLVLAFEKSIHSATTTATTTATATNTTKATFLGHQSHPITPEISYQRLPQLHVFLGHLVKRYVAVAVCHHTSLRLSPSKEGRCHLALVAKV